MKIISKNYKGEDRKVGIELEYAGMSLSSSIEAIKELFGGSDSYESNLVGMVKNTELGDFKVELDAIPLQKIAKEAESYSDTKKDILKAISEVGEVVIPFEIVSPPILIEKINHLQKLCGKIKSDGAKGTSDHFYYAFGMHFNPEVCSTDSTYIVRHLQSFLLLYPLLLQQHEIDLTRRLTSFVDPFPDSYFKHIITTAYQPDIETLIKDYHQNNPTRNRALDMTPLFAFLNEPLVRELYGKYEKINKRPTFHYRLPNCDLRNENWSIEGQWNIWLKVEELANDENRLKSLIHKWQEHQNQLVSLEYKWLETLKEELPGYD